MELQETLPHADALLLGTTIQGLLVARAEFRKVMFWIRCCLLDLINPPGIIRDIFLMLRIDSVYFPIRSSISEQG